MYVAPSLVRYTRAAVGGRASAWDGAAVGGRVSAWDGAWDGAWEGRRAGAAAMIGSDTYRGGAP
jgi:hypothetical protein